MQGLKPPATKQLKNEEALTKYAAFLCSLMLFVTAARWLRKICIKSPHLKSRVSSPTYGREACLLVFQNLQRRVPWKRFERPSLGFIMIIGIYLAGNIAFCSNMLAMPQLLNHWSSRFGWMCVGNMALCVFFGLKNTPLSPLAAVSHSQLNVFHRIVGYTTVTLVLLHAAVYTIHFGRQGRLVQLLKPEDIAGIGAGVAMLVLLMGIFRHNHYELFYVSHITGFLVVVLLTALHRPNWAKKIPLVMLIIFSMWALDRLIRLIRLSCNLVNNSATFYPLPDGGTRVILKKPGTEAALPGSHCLLWIPRLRTHENHPFTIVSNDSSGLELVMKSHEGFTRAVGTFASQNPGSTLWASIDGPYGSLPDVNHYDKLILVAGGSGAAFTFGFMNRIMMQPEKAAVQSIEFVWAVKRIEQLNWFRRHLVNIAKAEHSPRLKVYVTDEQLGSSSAATTSTASERQQFVGEEESESLLREDTFNYDTISPMGDIRELLHQTTSDEQTSNFIFEKLGIDKVIAEALGTAGWHQRVLVVSCGPKSLMGAVVDAADKWQNTRGLRIDVHCEDFDSC
ncbi:hypothetical protein FSHL1_006771 [Fusarium sambucinum]